MTENNRRRQGTESRTGSAKDAMPAEFGLGMAAFVVVATHGRDRGADDVGLHGRDGWGATSGC